MGGKDSIFRPHERKGAFREHLLGKKAFNMTQKGEGLGKGFSEREDEVKTPPGKKVILSISEKGGSTTESSI